MSSNGNENKLLISSDEVRCGCFIYFPKNNSFLILQTDSVIMKHKGVKHQAAKWEDTFSEKLFQEPEKEK